MRTRPQVVYSQNEWSSSSITQCSRIAGQSVLAGKRGNAAILQPAEPALGGGPERSVRIESKVVHTALAQPVGG